MRGDCTSCGLSGRLINGILLAALAVAIGLGVIGLGSPAAWATSSEPLAAFDARPANPTCVAGAAPSLEGTVAFEPAFSEIAARRPFDVRVSPTDTQSYYFISRDGRMFAYTPGKTPVLALNITDRIGINSAANAYSEGGSEQWGLVSLAFHPKFASDPARRWVFVIYNGRQQAESTTTSYLSRFTLNADGVTFDPDSELVVLKLTQKTDWLHHFGNVAFGPDGYLYLGSGDGTLNGYPWFRDVPSQFRDDLRGKLLRLDVDAGTPAQPYRIPPDNPWVGDAGSRPEIYADGLRNPWRFSFDTLTGELWLGDVGDARFEEIDRIEAGANYGWPVYDGTLCRQSKYCTKPGLTAPLWTMDHNGQSIAIIGGIVYRGTAIPALAGRFVFQIYGKRELYALKRDNGSYVAERLLGTSPNISAFFADAEGELYGVERTGQIYKLVPSTTRAGTAIPRLLSHTGCVRRTNPHIAAQGLIPYTVNTELWSDGAAKRRWVALPDGASIGIKADGDFDFQIGRAHV